MKVPKLQWISTLKKVKISVVSMWTKLSSHAHSIVKVVQWERLRMLCTSIHIYIRISLFTLQYNYDKTTWKLIKIRKWYSKLWCSENIAYMYVHNENFWGRKLLKFCGYSRKCSMQSLVRIAFVGSSKQLIKFYYTKIFFPPIHESFLLQNFLFLAPTDTNIYQTLCLENCWLLFTFCSVQTNLFT